MPPPPEYNGDDNSNLPPPPTFGFNAPPPSFGPPSPSTVGVDLPPPPPTSLPSFGNLPPPPQEETVVKRKSHSNHPLPSAPMSWDQTSEAKARRKSRSKLPSPPGNSGDNNDSPPPLPKSLSLSRMLHNDSPHHRQQCQHCHQQIIYGMTRREILSSLNLIHTSYISYNIFV